MFLIPRLNHSNCVGVLQTLICCKVCHFALKSSGHSSEAYICTSHILQSIRDFDQLLYLLVLDGLFESEFQNIVQQTSAEN